jgi:hypothetical protein
MDLSRHADKIARALLGEPNKTLSNREQLRFGANGSIAVEISGEKAGSWFDHENGIGGGLLDLIQREKGINNGAAFDWCRSIGIELGTRQAKQKVIATYIYRDQHGEPMFMVSRWGPKKAFTQSRYDASTGSFVSGKGCMDGVRRVPYRLDEWHDAEAPVLVAEGEKDADRLAATGLLATCNPGGAGKWLRGFAPYFQDRDVVILPDNDQAGRNHARDIAECLLPIAAGVVILELPGQPEKGDVSDWLAAGHSVGELHDLIEKAPEAAEVLKAWAGPAANGQDPAKHVCLTPAAWAARQIPPEDKLLGPFSTTTRSQLSADTGLGKTMFGLALAFAIRLQRGFLHWEAGDRRPPRVLYLDGEMPAELIKARLAAAASWFDLQEPIEDGLFILSREDAEAMPPLDTEDGATWVLAFIEQIEGIDFAIFDNIAALTTGELKEEQSAQTIKDLQREITSRRIGQLWLHHTGHDATRGYGSKMREWWLDTAMVAEKLDLSGRDVAFKLRFPKCRRRMPDNRSDYDEVEVALHLGQWSYTESSAEGSSVRPLGRNQKHVYDAAMKLLASLATVAPPPGHPARGRPVVAVDAVRDEARRLMSDDPKHFSSRFSEAFNGLTATGRLQHYDGWVWQ